MPLYRLIYTHQGHARGITAWSESVEDFRAVVLPFLPAGAKQEAILPVIGRQGSAEDVLRRLRQKYPLLYTSPQSLY